MPPCPGGRAASRDGAGPVSAAGPSRPALAPRLLLAVAVGGAVGALARWGLTEAWPADADGFPWATLAINVSG